ncbi:MAG: hypothetical protein ACK56F_14585, partial [bacterium]
RRVAAGLPGPRARPAHRRGHRGARAPAGRHHRTGRSAPCPPLHRQPAAPAAQDVSYSSSANRRDSFVKIDHPASIDTSATNAHAPRLSHPGNALSYMLRRNPWANTAIVLKSSTLSTHTGTLPSMSDGMYT